MDIDSRYPLMHRLPRGVRGERAGDYINLGLGLSPLPQREKQRTIYSLDHARSGSNLHSASVSPLSFRSRHLPAVLDYCLDRNDFHGVSRAEGPSQLTWMMSLNRLWLIVFQVAPDSGLVSRCRHGRGMADLPTHVPPNTPFSACILSTNVQA